MKNPGAPARRIANRPELIDQVMAIFIFDLESRNKRQTQRRRAHSFPKFPQFFDTLLGRISSDQRRIDRHRSKSRQSSLDANPPPPAPDRRPPDRPRARRRLAGRGRSVRTAGAARPGAFSAWGRAEPSCPKQSCLSNSCQWIRPAQWQTDSRSGRAPGHCGKTVLAVNIEHDLTKIAQFFEKIARETNVIETMRHRA